MDTGRDDPGGHERTGHTRAASATSADTAAQEPVVEPGTTAGAVFRATREELLGDHTLPDSAEIARSYCSVADRVVSVVAITPDGIRRVDCWLGDVGFVTHAATNDPAEPQLGSVCDRARAVELTGSIVGALVGGLPATAADAAVQVGPVGDIHPEAMPVGVDWIVVVSANRPDGIARPDRCVVAGAAGGSAVAALDALDTPVRAEPADDAAVERWIADLVGTPPRSVVELLADD